MIFASRYFIAYVLDLILGDPEFFYHPVRVIGKLISFLEKKLYSFKNKKIFGGVLVILVLTVTFIISYILAISKIIEIFFLYTTLATKCLADEGKKIYEILKSNDIERAKKEVSYLVSRDTGKMNEQQVIRSVVETIAENSVDGVIAPMFFAIIGSFFTWNGVSLALPFAMTYKAINTMDSMLGYKNEKYIDFGMIGAKVDDMANFLPARIAGGVIIPIGAFILRMDYKSAWRIFLRDRLNHGSPNSGHGEAAFAGALGLQFGGKTSYFGKIYDKPTIGDKKRDFILDDIKNARKLLYISSGIGLIIFLILSQLIKVVL